MYKNNSDDELIVSHEKEGIKYFIWNRFNWTPYCENDRCWDEIVIVDGNVIVSREELGNGVDHYLIHEGNLYIVYVDNMELYISCNGNVVHSISITDEEEHGYGYQSILVPLGRQLYLRRTQAVTGNVINIYVPNNILEYGSRLSWY